MNKYKLKAFIIEQLMMEAEQLAVIWRFREEEKYDKIFYKKGLQINSLENIFTLLGIDDRLIYNRFTNAFYKLTVATITKEHKRFFINLYVDDLFLISSNKKPKTLWVSSEINKASFFEFISSGHLNSLKSRKIMRQINTLEGT